MSDFKLKSGDPGFKDRQKKVFDQLLVLENNRKNSGQNSPRDGVSNSNRRAQRSETRHFRGKESIFKKPQNPAPKNYIHKIPDFQKNPHKWTKYSLEDVQEMTDESNKKSAMEFLKQLADRRKLEEEISVEEKMEELPSKVVFNKHVRQGGTRQQSIITQEASSTEQVSFNSSKVIMPEYVIGQKQIRKDKQKMRNKHIPEKGLELKLDHLAYEDE